MNTYVHVLPTRQTSAAYFKSIGGLSMEHEVIEYHGHLDSLKQVGDPATGPVARYHLEMAWPSKVEIGALNAGVWNRSVIWSHNAGSLSNRPVLNH